MGVPTTYSFRGKKNVPEHLDQLEDWFNSRPKWVQAAARILQSGRIRPNDIPPLVELCKAEVGLCDVPLEDNQLLRIPKGSSLGNKSPATFRLNSISQPKGINALAPRKPLQFGDAPISVVFGANGSGKSGYVRALKHACGIRQPGELLGNVFLQSYEEPSCKFSCAINGVTKDPQWSLGQGPVAEMGVIQIYDNRSAGIYVDEENEVAFEPSILNLFTQLTEVCATVSRSLEQEIGLKSSKKPILSAEFQTTKIGEWYAGMTHLTEAAEILAECGWTTEVEQELTQLNQRLTENNPAQTASTLRKRKSYLTELYDELERWAENLSDHNCELYLLAQTDSVSKRQAAQAAADTVFASAPLDGVGTESWKLLWEQARLYSERNAYPGIAFPNVSGDARCVLCQQTLDLDAQARFISFESFVKGQLETQARDAEERLKEKSDSLAGITSEELRIRMDSAGYNDEGGRSAVVSLRDGLDLRRAALIGPQGNAGIPLLPQLDALKRLKNEADALESQASNFDRDAVAENRPALESKCRELKARKWISQQRVAVESELLRLKQVHKLGQAQRLTSTQQLSLKKSNLSDELITEAYVKRFQSELDHLRSQHIRVKLVKTRAQRGHVLHRIQLEGCTKPVNTSDVLSDGECRVVSLAAFLADVEGREDMGSFVFDDPITSSDQSFEEATAARLVTLSQSRQVIVFTHRLSLVELVEEAAAKSGVKPCFLALRRAKWGIGDPDETYMHQSNPGAGLRFLLQRLPQGRKAFLQSSTEYELIAQGLCSHFRIVIERLVEKALLADVLTRFRRSVQTKNKIFELAKINAADCKLIDDLMTKYSRYEHSQPSETPAPLPEPDELEADIKSALSWLEEFTARPIQQSQ